jgi:IclR family KDG regulon transcriptional repressor
MQNKNTTVMKSMELLNLFIDHANLNLNDIVQMTNIPKTTIHRMVGSLQEMKLLQKNDQGQYSLGLLFLQYGELVKERLDIRVAALPVMKQLRDDIGEAVNLFIKDEKEALYIEKVDTNHPIRLFTKIGRRAPLYAGACARILLAYSSEADKERYLKEIALEPIGSGTITNADKLRSLLAETKANGYAFSISELENHTFALSAPLFDYSGEVVAGISIAGPEDRLNDSRMPELIAKVKTAALDISRKMGWIPLS